jgi:hypothetical protein
MARDSPATLRQALALILGTIARPDTDSLLREALERFKGDPAFERCALLALGAAREPEEDDDVFGLGDRPWGAKGPGGIGITVRRAVEDAETRAALARGLEGPAPEVREAAASALRHSLAAADARTSFLAAVARETTDGVATVLGESLAERAGATEDAGERKVLVSALLARAGEEGLDGFRFRMENDFRRIALEAPERAVLEDLASAAKPFGVRVFAMTGLANAATRSGGDAEAEIRALLERLLGRDHDSAVRDAAARLLGELPPGEGTAAVLARAARDDAAWNVRFSALDALAARAPRVTALEVMRAARSDPDARVAAEADRLLKRMAPGDYGK